MVSRIFDIANKGDGKEIAGKIMEEFKNNKKNKMMFFG